MADDYKVEVHGLRELNRALKHLDEELPKRTRIKLKAIAEKVAAAVRPKVPSITGKLARKIRPRATRSGASIVSTADYAGANEFGGWPKGRAFVATGRYLFPAVEAERSNVEEELFAALDEMITEAGLG